MADDPPRPRRFPLSWLLALAALYAATGAYSVRTNERAVVRRCGRALARVRGPGLHWGAPWGIDRVDRVKVLETKRVGVGMTLTRNAVGRRGRPLAAEALTGDRNLILLSAIVQYRVKDPRRYVCASADPTALVRCAAAAALASIVSSMRVDDVLTRRRVAIQNAAQTRTQAALDRYGAGVTVLSVSLSGVEPPKEVADAFRDVTAARGDKERAVNEAKGYANRRQHEAEAEAYRIRREAEAQADALVRRAHAAAESFLKQAAEFDRDRAEAGRRLILETAEAVLPRLKKVWLGPGVRRGLDLGLLEKQP